jgi:copper oxidase (laccase) domain-containing protein
MAREVVLAMEREFGSRPGAVVAGIGPSIGPCCYQVGPEVACSFREHGLTPVMRGDRLDLWESTALQLSGAGVSAIETADICTACNTSDFFSHRSEDGVTGRFGLVAGLTA